MSLSFKGHTVVITGAGGGLGKAYVGFLLCRITTELFGLQLFSLICITGG